MLLKATITFHVRDELNFIKAKLPTALKYIRSFPQQQLS